MDAGAKGLSWSDLLLHDIPELLTKAELHLLSEKAPIPSSSIVHDHPELCVVLEGAARIDTSDQPLHVQRGSILVVAPFMYHLAISTTESSDMLWVGITPEHAGLGGVRHYRDSSYSILFGTEIMNEGRLYEMIVRLEEELTAHPEGWELLCRTLIAELCIIMLRRINSPDSESLLSFASTSRSENVVRKARGFVEKHFRKPISLADVAHYVALSPNYLANLFKHKTDITIMGYLTGLRIREAQRLLTRTDKTVAEIAFEVGYNSPYYFSRQFRSETSLSPREYRMSHAG
jgi:AraC-like DNA-binding protein/mannose-6-phosphate isomerase-like protein (cupin superfamily)